MSGCKLSVFGTEVFAVRNPSALAGIRATGRPCPVGGAVRDVALCCGRLFGLGLYGPDVLEGPAGPVVLDLNYFPSYLGVPSAAPLIAAYIADNACGLYRELQPLAAGETLDGCARNGHAAMGRSWPSSPKASARA